MPRSFQANPGEVEGRTDEYVEQIFKDLQSAILILPESDNFADEADFGEGFEALKRHTDNFTEITLRTLGDAIREDPIAFIIVRVILGFTPTEWAHLAGERAEVDIPQNYARDLDNKAAKRESGFAHASKVRTERIKALLEYAVHILNGGVGDVPEDVLHRLDTIDTGPESVPLDELAGNGVPYHTLLFERYFGRPFASYRDSVSEKVGDRMEDAVESELNDESIPYYRTATTEVIEGFDQAPDFLIPSREEPDVVIEAKITGDDGTARDKVTRVQHLSTLSKEWGERGGHSFQVVACIDGRGFGIRKEDMRKLLRATKGKVFTTKTISQLVDHTRIGNFRPGLR